MSPASAGSGADTKLTDFDRRVYVALCAHAFDEAVCWPSQIRIACYLGASREAVCRSCYRLREAGWLTWIKIKRPGRWAYNQYELHAAYCVSPLTAKRIVKRARRRDFLRALFARKAGKSGLDHTNSYGVHDDPVVPAPWGVIHNGVSPSERMYESLRDRWRLRVGLVG